MDENLMSEVEQEISKILSRNKCKKKVNKWQYCRSETIQENLNLLEEEFDCFDVSYLEEPFDLSTRKSLKTIIVQLINSSYGLIHEHREVQTKNRDVSIKNYTLSREVKVLQKQIDRLREDILEKDSQITITKQKTCLDKKEKDELKNTINNLKKELNIRLKENASEQVKHKHEMQKVLAEGRRLENKFGKKCGVYVSCEKQMSSVIDDYKKNEEIYKNTIEKLQKNNQELLEIIVNLKEELSATNIKKK